MGASTAYAWGAPIALLVESWTLLFILWTSAVGRRTLGLATLLVLIALGVSLISTASGGFALRAAGVIGCALAAMAPPAIARRLLRAERVTPSVIFGAICLYLIAGLFFAYLFAAVAAFDGGSFFAQQPTNGIDFLYFSLVTLTTLGYGDLTPQTGLGKMLAATEALSGQLYLVSIVAVLVSNIGRARPRRPVETDVESEETRS